jgi:hypothetical protein
MGAVAVEGQCATALKQHDVGRKVLPGHLTGQTAGVGAAVRTWVSVTKAGRPVLPVLRAISAMVGTRVTVLPGSRGHGR